MSSNDRNVQNQQGSPNKSDMGKHGQQQQKQEGSTPAAGKEGQKPSEHKVQHSTK